MGKVKKAFGAFLVPLLSVLLAFLIGGIIMLPSARTRSLP